MRETTTISRSAQSSLLTCATDDEIFVAQILVDLPTTIGMLESGSGFKWGRKKRRSRLDEGASSPNCAPSSSYAEIEEGHPHSKTEHLEIAAANATAAASPVTPLAFWPEEKSKLTSKRSSSKRPRKEYIGVIQELTERRDLLRGEIENLTNYYNKLTAYNSQLKAIKEGKVAHSCPRKEEPAEVEVSRERNVGLELTTNHHQVNEETESQALAADQKFEHPTSFHSSLIHVGLPDLNISAEDAFCWDSSQPLDMSRAFTERRIRFAQARRRRMDIIKSMRRSASGVKFSRTRYS